MNRLKCLRRRRRTPLREQLLYRRSMAVMEIHVFPQCHGAPSYPVCPRCGKTMEREYLPFCSRCGQKLDWQHYLQARIIYVEPNHDRILSEDAVCSR